MRLFNRALAVLAGLCLMAIGPAAFAACATSTAPTITGGFAAAQLQQLTNLCNDPKAAVVSTVFTRPSDTTAYAVGDLVANSTTAGSVTPMSFASITREAAGTATITRARLITSSTSTTNASFRVHLYTSAPTATNGDNGAWLTTRSGRFCTLDVTVDAVFSDGAQGTGTPVAGSTCTFTLASGSTIRGLIEARAAYTPTSAGTFTVELEVLQ